MTDTTDIKALPKMTLDELLIRCTDYDDGSLSMDAGELKMLNQHISLLEAERQRADDLVLHVNTQANMREKAEAELAELKAKLANPVVLPDGSRPCTMRHGEQSTSYKAVMSGKGDWLHKDMVVTAICEAGFTVKGDL
jgi:hypothetical protein